MIKDQYKSSLKQTAFILNLVFFPLPIRLRFTSAEPTIIAPFGAIIFGGG